MELRELKNACNKKYAQAIDGLERGEPNTGIARLLLDAAELLIKISKADFLMRVTSESKASKLLAAAKKLRTTGDAAAVYQDLTGSKLQIQGAQVTKKETSEVSAEQEKAVTSVAEQRIGVSEGKAEAEKQVGLGLAELKQLLQNGKGKGRAYGKEDTGGYRFDWDDLPKISFDDVAGLADVKEAVLRKVLLPLKNPELYEGYVKKNGGGLLLYGPPGTGKTMIAAAIAHEIGAKFCSLGPSDLVLGGVGNSEKAAVALFKEARSFPCSVLFFDEMESICPASTRAQGGKTAPQ